MSTTRIKDLVTASAIADDDYIALDGQTNGTRKVLASDVGGGGSETWYDFTSSLSPSINANGVGSYVVKVTPTNADDAVIARAIRAKGYLHSSTDYNYVLLTTDIRSYSNYFIVTFKCIYASTQATSTSTVSGMLHIVAPFEISSVLAWM